MKTRGLAALALFCLASGCTSRAEPPPVLGSLPELELVDQTGRAIGRSDLAGEPFVANFIFTRCVTSCPLLTSQMVNLQKRLGGDAERVKMVSISVDPEYDTPEVLARYAEERGATRRWLFLTGEYAAIAEAVQRGFRVRVGDRVPHGDGFDILHATHFVLVDAELNIRGYFRNDAEGQAELLEATRAILAAP